jgi:LysM repeat protein
MKSTGGPLYPFSFGKNPFLKTPAVRYDEGGQTYTVKSGDYLGKIAGAYGLTVGDIVSANPGLNPDKINVGQVLNIPNVNKTPSKEAIVSAAW